MKRKMLRIRETLLDSESLSLFNLILVNHIHVIRKEGLNVSKDYYLWVTGRTLWAIRAYLNIRLKT